MSPAGAALNDNLMYLYLTNGQEDVKYDYFYLILDYDSLNLHGFM